MRKLFHYFFWRIKKILIFAPLFTNHKHIDKYV